VTERNEQFPRSTDLPIQSPLFWVEQKDRYLRQLLIRDIEELTSRRLVVYFANRYANAQIDPRDSTFITELFGDIGTSPVDLMLETTGGATDATESLITVISNLTQDLRVIVANAAKSNGTLLALAAKSIVMGAASELGPIEPSVQNIPVSILIQDEIKKQNFALHKFGEFALTQTKNLAKKLLSNGMLKGRLPEEIDEVIRKLASRDVYASHGSAIDHKEARALGLNLCRECDNYHRPWGGRRGLVRRSKRCQGALRRRDPASLKEFSLPTHSDTGTLIRRQCVLRLRSGSETCLRRECSSATPVKTGTGSRRSRSRRLSDRSAGFGC
jgi:hypothetical protein